MEGGRKRGGRHRQWREGERRNRTRRMVWHEPQRRDRRQTQREISQRPALAAAPPRRKTPSLLRPSHFDVGLCRRSRDGRRTVRRTARRADSNAEVGADNGAGGVRKRNLARGPARTTAQGPAPIPTRRAANATSRCLLWLIVVSDRRASEAFRCGHRRVISPRSHRSRESHVAMGLETLSLLPPTLQWDSKR